MLNHTVLHEVFLIDTSADADAGSVTTIASIRAVANAAIDAHIIAASQKKAGDDDRRDSRVP
jgi:hypothetical protein